MYSFCILFQISETNFPAGRELSLSACFFLCLPFSPSLFPYFFLLFPDLLRLLLVADFNVVHHIHPVLIGLFQSNFPLDIAMDRTDGNTVIIFGISGKPQQFFSGVSAAEAAMGSPHLP